MTAEIKRAIDGNLQGLQLQEVHVQQIMQRVYEEKAAARPAQRRRSPYGALAMAAALMVMLVTAVGLVLAGRTQTNDALLPLTAPVETAFTPIEQLSAKEFINTYVLPMALDNNNQAFTVEQSREILSKAEDYGYRLAGTEAQRVLDAVQKGQGALKVDVINALVQSQLGQDFFTWSTEDQAWLDDIHVQIGHMATRLYTAPKEDALTTDTTRFEEGSDYLNIRQDHYHSDQFIPAYAGEYWKVIWRPKTLDDRGFSVYFSEEGKLLGMYDGDTGVHEGSPIERMLLRFNNLYGSMEDWSHATLQEFHRWVVVSGSTNDQGGLCL